MDISNEENFTSFLSKNKTGNEIGKTENIGLKCMRKKYKCIMIWLLSIITFSQFLIILFEKLDEKFVNKFVEKMYNLIKPGSNSTCMNETKEI